MDTPQAKIFSAQPQDHVAVGAGLGPQRQNGFEQGLRAIGVGAAETAGQTQGVDLSLIHI